MEINLRKHKALDTKFGLPNHLLMMRFALDCISCADLVSHGCKNSIMIPQKTTSHDIIVFPNKFNILCMLVTLPVSMPRFGLFF